MADAKAESMSVKLAFRLHCDGKTPELVVSSRSIQMVPRMRSLGAIFIYVRLISIYVHLIFIYFHLIFIFMFIYFHVSQLLYGRS